MNQGFNQQQNFNNAPINPMNPQPQLIKPSPQPQQPYVVTPVNPAPQQPTVIPTPQKPIVTPQPQVINPAPQQPTVVPNPVVVQPQIVTPIPQQPTVVPTPQKPIVNPTPQNPTPAPNPVTPQPQKPQVTQPANPTAVTNNTATKPATEQIKPIAGQEDFGVVAPPIPPPSSSQPLFFPDEQVDKRTRFSSHQNPNSSCNWVQFHEQIKGEFYDTTFDSKDEKSLLGLNKFDNPSDQADMEKLKTLTWKRLSYCYPDVQVIKNGVEAQDIYQGSLGDCYLLSSLSSIAEFPDRVKRILRQQQRSPKGAYAVSLCITGQFETFYIDDLVPVKNNRLAFCHSDLGELWAILIEKAYAKAYGGYWNIGNGGFSEPTLRDLTGAPSECVTWFEKEEEAGIFPRIFEGDKMNYIMNCGTKGSGEEKKNNGIIQGHAYTLEGVFKLPNGDELVKLRNPWGRGEWTGDYGDKSPKWTPELKKQLGWTDKDDGTFFMPMQNFLEEYDNVAICHYREDFILSNLFDINPSNAFACYQFNIDMAGDHYFGLSQPDKFSLPLNHTYGMHSVIVAKQGSNGLEYVGGKGKPQRDNWFMAKCQPGKYIAFVSTIWDNNNTNDTSFWVYGPKQIEISRAKLQSNLSRLPDLFAQTMIHNVRNDVAHKIGPSKQG